VISISYNECYFHLHSVCRYGSLEREGRGRIPLS
jgi:hypothetical protein